MEAALQTLSEKGLSPVILAAMEEYFSTGDRTIPLSIPTYQATWKDSGISQAIIDDLAWDETTRTIFRFLILLSSAASDYKDERHHLLAKTLAYMHSDRERSVSSACSWLAEEIGETHQALVSFLVFYIYICLKKADWTVDEPDNAEYPFASQASNLVYVNLDTDFAQIPELLASQPGIFPMVTVHRPEITRAWCDASASSPHNGHIATWKQITLASRDYDSACLVAVQSLRETDPLSAFHLLRNLNNASDGTHAALLMEFAKLPEAALHPDALSILMDLSPMEIIPILTRSYPAYRDYHWNFKNHPAPYLEADRIMFNHWEDGGRGLFSSLIESTYPLSLNDLLKKRLPKLEEKHFPALHSGFHKHIYETSGRDKTDVLQLALDTYPQAFAADFEKLLVAKSKPLRLIAAKGLAATTGKLFVEKAAILLCSSKPDQRVSAALFFEFLADTSHVSLLRATLEKEETDEVRNAIHNALKACSIGAPLEDIPSLDQLESKASKFDLEKVVALFSWLSVQQLPPLSTSDDSALSPNLLAFLISRQSKHKTISAAPDVIPLLALIDRGNSSPFAAALVEQFLNSNQAAADRWALALGGLLGDSRIITLLLPRINDWCENSRHKLAEYAAQAISLVPGNEPLMVLDTLANRYRSKFKNVGKACAEAFKAAATVRGITTDELGDLVVPDFGFDSEGIRRLEWNGGGASAELGADFKLTWFDPETDKAWKALPASAPEEIKTEVKTLTKLLREAVKGQTARLEMTLVRQRRWPVARWRELFENHPLLRSFASNLVWGVYDGGGILLRTFRRYPNGLLADAAGALEELPESDTMIGMVHPLELDAASLEAWRAHLGRFKVKAPFPQIDRPVELLNPLHGNRRSITLTDKKSASAGTFRSRAEKRGWNRGSVIDAGGISSYYKIYPGAGVEVILPTDNFWVGFDPMDTIELGAAYFVKAESVERGSYVYNEPGPDDPRVLRFDQVPPVVFSETLSDLKVIIATKE